MGKLRLIGIFSHCDEYKKCHFIFTDTYNRNKEKTDSSRSQLEKIDEKVKEDISAESYKYTCPFYTSYNKSFYTPGPHYFKCTSKKSDWVPGKSYTLDCTWKKFTFTADNNTIIGWTLNNTNTY